MKSKKTSSINAHDLFRSELVNMLNLRHELCQLSELINWSSLDESFGELFPSDTGCPATPTRLIVGLFYLKAIYNLSDEQLVLRWVENPYWQYFCGEKYLRHDFPIDPSTMSKWRRRLKETDCEKLLQESISAGLKSKTIKAKDLEKAVIDTTVQEKNITYPTDAKLYKKGIDLLVKKAEELGIKLKQTYVRVSKKAFFQTNNFYRLRRMKKAKKETKKLKTFLGRLMRDFERKIAKTADISSKVDDLLSQVKRVLLQQKTDKNKLYSFHAPEVECIGKGKAHKKYEFGVKVSVTSPLHTNFVIGIKSLPGNPFDGHTLTGCLDQVENLTGVRPKDVFADNGYRGNKEKQSNIFVARTAKSRKTKTVKKLMRRRNAVEPLIGHLKSDGHLKRNYLKGKFGDFFNAVMSGVGYNFRMILKKLRLFLSFYFLLNLMQIFSFFRSKFPGKLTFV